MMHKGILLKIIIAVGILSSLLFAQSENNIPLDTSFTVYSAYKKVIKKFPFAKIVTPSIHSGINSIENLVYIKYGEREMHLDLFLPKQDSLFFPCVILVHGGGWHSGNKSHMKPMAIDLAAKGFVTAAVEYRFLSEAIYPAAVKDLKASVKWLKANAAKYEIDTTRIAILGCSAGGQLASLVGFTKGLEKYEPGNFFPDISSSVHAVINIDGLLDFTSSESKEFDVDPRKPKSAHLWFGSSFKDNPELWKEGSAYYHVDKNDVPIIFINSSLPHYHAGRDAMVEKLRKFNIYFEIHNIKETPHPFWLFHPWYSETLDFVGEFLEKIFLNKVNKIE